MRTETEKKRMPLIEIFLGQLILYIVVWFISQDAARIFTLLFPGIFAAVLLISLISEALERSRVPRIFFYFLVISIIAPLLAAAFMVFFAGMKFGFGGIFA